MKILPRGTFNFPPEHAGGAIFTVNPSAVPVELPDYLKDDDLLKLAVRDGSIIMVDTPKQAFPLEKHSTAELIGELKRRELEQGSGSTRYAAWPDSGDGTQYPSGPGSMLGSTPGTPAPALKAAAEQQQKKAEAANLANVGKGADHTIHVMTDKSGDEKTARDNAPAVIDPKNPPPASVDPNAKKDRDGKVIDSKDSK